MLEGTILNSNFSLANDVLMYVGGVLLLRIFPFVGEVRLTVLTRFKERAAQSFRTIDRVGPSKRDFKSRSEIIVW